MSSVPSLSSARAPATDRLPIALALGITSAMLLGSLYDRSVTMATITVISVPEFMIATSGVLIFAVWLKWLPALSFARDVHSFGEMLRIYAMPVFTLSFVISAQMIRMSRAAVVETLNTPYVEMAQLKGASRTRVVLRHAAIVGKIDRPTPIVNSKINEIIVNPYWTSPVSIVRKDIIPLMRKDPNYLKDSHIRLFAPDGSEVDPLNVDWSTEEATKYRFRQDPGSNNAMASVKINFPSPDGVYMHDTPQQSLFGKLMRFDSSGCVRVQNVRDLVTWILRDTPGWDRQSFEAAIKTGENRPVAVTNPVPVHFLYVTAWSTGPGVVQFRDDIYREDGVDSLQITSSL